MSKKKSFNFLNFKIEQLIQIVSEEWHLFQKDLNKVYREDLQDVNPSALSASQEAFLPASRTYNFLSKTRKKVQQPLTSLKQKMIKQPLKKS